MKGFGPSVFGLRITGCFSRGSELDQLVALTAQHLSRAMPATVWPYMTEEEIANTWINIRLRQDDWIGLAQHTLAEVYHESLLVPLEDTERDCCFNLQV